MMGAVGKRHEVAVGSVLEAAKKPLRFRICRSKLSTWTLLNVTKLKQATLP